MDRKEEDANYNNYIEEEIERIKSENPGVYFKREDLLQLMRIPRCSKSLIVIKCNYKGTGFRRDGYIAEYLKDKISEDEFKKVIDNASFIMKKLYSKKRSADAMKTPFWAKIRIFLSILLLLTYLVLAYIAIDRPSNLLFDCFQYGCLVSAIILMIMATVIEYVRGSYIFKSYESMVKKSLDKYFNKLNKESYESRGMEWYIVPNHYWVELRVLSARSNASQNIGPNNAYEQVEKSKQPEVPLTSPDPEPIKNIEIVQENVQNQPPQFYEKQKEEYENIKDEEYDIEKVEYYQEESVHEDESRPMNTEYMNPNEDKRSYQNDYQQFNEEFSRDAIELNNEGYSLALFFSLPIYFLLIFEISLFLDYEHKPEEYGQERKDTESYPMNAKTGLQSSKMMTNNDIGHEGDHEGDHEIENDIDNEIDQEIEELNLFK